MDNTIPEHFPDSLCGQRIDQALATLYPDYSRSQIKQWLKNGWVTLDDPTPHTPVKPNYKVRAGQRVYIQRCLFEHHDVENPTPSISPAILDIVYEDDDFLVINKPIGMVVHPGAGHLDGTLMNALLHHRPSLLNLPRAGLIHRLDKNTSGLLIVAATPTAYLALSQAMKERAIRREYIALVNGQMTATTGTINAPIARHPVQRTKMAVVLGGRTAITHYRVLEVFPAHTLLSIQLETGRTHQIRVHMHYIKHPIWGDPVYTQKNNTIKNTACVLKRQALHAFQLTLHHPRDHTLLTFNAPLPDDMKEAMQIIGNSGRITEALSTPFHF